MGLQQESKTSAILDDRNPIKTFKSASLQIAVTYLEIDREIKSLIVVEFYYKNEFSPVVFLKPVGDYVVFEKSYLALKKLL